MGKINLNKYFSEEEKQRILDSEFEMHSSAKRFEFLEELLAYYFIFAKERKKLFEKLESEDKNLCRKIRKILFVLDMR